MKQSPSFNKTFYEEINKLLSTAIHSKKGLEILNHKTFELLEYNISIIAFYIMKTY